MNTKNTSQAKGTGVQYRLDDGCHEEKVRCEAREEEIDRNYSAASCWENDGRLETQRMVLRCGQKVA